MSDQTEKPSEAEEQADPEWFRQPTRREHLIAAALFIGFGLFFAMLFVVLAGWWPRWVILGLGVYSAVYGIRHALDARGLKRQSDLERIEIGAKRRWGGILSYAIAVLTVASILTWLLGQFTNSWWLALGLVGFMLGYMLLMGYLASRDRR